MPATLRLGRVAGNPIGLHFSWFVIGALMTPIQLAAAVTTTVLWLSGTTAATAEDHLSVQASPYTSIEPARVRLLVRVERDKANRSMVIVVDSPRLFRSSLIPLNGDSAPSVHLVDLKSLPEGRYTVTVVLRRDDRTTTTATDSFQVVG
jgi:hypothetical protein